MGSISTRQASNTVLQAYIAYTIEQPAAELAPAASLEQSSLPLPHAQRAPIEQPVTEPAAAASIEQNHFPSRGLGFHG